MNKVHWYNFPSMLEETILSDSILERVLNFHNIHRLCLHYHDLLATYLGRLKVSIFDLVPNLSRKVVSFECGERPTGYTRSSIFDTMRNWRRTRRQLLRLRLHLHIIKIQHRIDCFFGFLGYANVDVFLLSPRRWVVLVIRDFPPRLTLFNE